MREELHAAVVDCLDRVPAPPLRRLTENEEELVTALAILACFARSPVERDYRTRELPDVLAEAIEATLPPREDRDPDAPLFPDVGADRLRTAIGRA
jgi:hypothetical protein